MKIVVAEDQADFRNLLVDFLKEEGHEVTECEDGSEAYEAALRLSAAGDIILITDVMMPKMDGVELLRKLAEQNVRVKTVVLSAYLNDAVMSRMARLGVSAILRKPVDLVELSKVLQALAEGRPSGFESRSVAVQEEKPMPAAVRAEEKQAEGNASRAPACSPPAPAPVAGPAVAANPAPTARLSAKTEPSAPPKAEAKEECTKETVELAPPAEVIQKASALGALQDGCVRVLVADDDPDFASLMKDMLSGAGYAVTLAHDGNEAVEKALAEDFCVVFMDLMMPGIGGAEAIRRIHRAEPGLLVVAVTGKAGPVDQADAMQAGAFKILEKPIAPDALRQNLMRWSLIAERRRRVTAKYAAIPAPKVPIFGIARRRRVAVLILLFLIFVGLLVPQVHRVIDRGLRGIMEGITSIGRVIGVIERTEGYLQRDEERELRREQ
jgi:CheY-like chemotaxis protein